MGTLYLLDNYLQLGKGTTITVLRIFSPFPLNDPEKRTFTIYRNIIEAPNKTTYFDRATSDY